mmetsp:Transcript_17263/g.32688  ORF Transcript_17263/g.32688 Transcript_17263/m.32688 type:complete len:113 (-) Transcript_17263:1314-1652(-)
MLLFVVWIPLPILRLLILVLINVLVLDRTEDKEGTAPGKKALLQQDGCIKNNVESRHNFDAPFLFGLEYMYFMMMHTNTECLWIYILLFIITTFLLVFCFRENTTKLLSAVW